MADPVVHLTNGLPDSGTGNITTLGQTLLDGANVTIGAKADAKSIATDATAISAISIWKQISASVQAIATSVSGTLTVASHAVTNAGTFLVQAAQSGTWTVQPGNTPNTTPWLAKISDGTNAAAIKAASTAPVATDPALVVAISPNSVNANGQTTMAASAPVVIASNQSSIPVAATTVDPYSQYETVAASATAQVLGATGGTGDYLAGVLVFPGTAACGVVTILDNATTIGTFPGGGTTALPSLVPFMIPLGLFSVSGAWKITTGANVTAVGVGKFT